MQVQKEKFKILLPVLIVGLACVVMAALILSKPKADKRRGNTNSKISVEAVEVLRSSITPKILSYGLVEPRTRTTLVAQVSGRIESVSEQFSDGGFFRKGEILLQIDATDSQIELDIAQASLAEAEQGLAEELALVEQAKADWERLGDGGAPNALVLRAPQLKAAEASVSSAKALLKQAKVNLERTSVVAPYDGRVLSKNVDLGQVTTNNTVLGNIYATDVIEVRLPIKNNDLPLLKLPEDYSHQDESSKNLPAVSIRSELAKEETWLGSIVRTAGSIDNNSRQLNVVARIDDPFGEKAEGRFPLKIGQYVTAEIDGVSLESVLSIPNKAIYQGSYVYIYKEGAVYRTPIEISWQNSGVAIVSQGLSEGDQVVVSPLGQVSSGTAVELTQLIGKTDLPKVDKAADNPVLSEEAESIQQSSGGIQGSKGGAAL